MKFRCCDRVHEPPEFSRIQRKVRDFVKLLGLPFPEQPTQADYQAVIDATKDRIDAPSIHAVLLRSMMQSLLWRRTMQVTLVWPTKRMTHFTSPIRGYPDLLLHRAIKAQLKKNLPISGARWMMRVNTPSATERRADEASRLSLHG